MDRLGRSARWLRLPEPLRQLGQVAAVRGSMVVLRCECAILRYVLRVGEMLRDAPFSPGSPRGVQRAVPGCADRHRAE
jgi:hypothetical protein